MVTKVSVDIPICGKKAIVITKMNPSGNISIDIESDCDFIKNYSKNLKEVSIKDACMQFEKNLVFILASKNNVTSTCIVPSAIMNAVWVEAGLIAKNLALKPKTNELKIMFEE